METTWLWVQVQIWTWNLVAGLPACGHTYQQYSVVNKRYLYSFMKRNKLLSAYCKIPHDQSVPMAVTHMLVEVLTTHVFT